MGAVERQAVRSVLGGEVDHVVGVASWAEAFARLAELEPHRRLVREPAAAAAPPPAPTAVAADAAASGLTRLAYLSDAPGGPTVGVGFENGAIIPLARAPAGPYADEAAAITAGVPSRGYWEDLTGVVRRRTT